MSVRQSVGGPRITAVVVVVLIVIIIVVTVVVVIFVVVVVALDVILALPLTMIIYLFFSTAVHSISLYFSTFQSYTLLFSVLMFLSEPSVYVCLCLVCYGVLRWRRLLSHIWRIFRFYIISSYFRCSTFLEATPLMLFLLVYITPLASLCRMPRMLGVCVVLLSWLGHLFLDEVNAAKLSTVEANNKERGERRNIRETKTSWAKERREMKRLSSLLFGIKI